MELPRGIAIISAVLIALPSPAVQGGAGGGERRSQCTNNREAVGGSGCTNYEGITGAPFRGWHSTGYARRTRTVPAAYYRWGAWPPDAGIGAGRTSQRR